MESELSTAPTAPVEQGPPEPVVVPLLEPADGVPPVITTAAELADVVEAFAAGTGPVAVDAERASGYRYGQRTYLVQLRREGAGTALIDPSALPDLSSLSDALVGVEWVLHAASQDLPGLVEQGMRPSRIFDTELGARLLGLERVGLAAVVAELLGVGLAKEHSAVDWSTRPLPPEWLRYAALDVEVLIELRAVMADRLAEAGKAEWAAQEFEAVRLTPPPAPADRAVAARLRPARDPRRRAASPSCASCGRPATATRASGTSRPAACCRTPRSSPPDRPCPGRSRRSARSRRSPARAPGGASRCGRPLCSAAC